MIINLARRCSLILGRSFARNIRKTRKPDPSQAEVDQTLFMAGQISESEPGSRYQASEIDNEGYEELDEPSKEQPRFKLIEMLDTIDEKQCRGCGAKFQFDDSTKEGHIDLKRIRSKNPDAKMEELIEKLVTQKSSFSKGDSTSLHEEPENSNKGADRRLYTLEEYENDPLSLNSIQEIESLFEEKVLPKEVCDRCVLINRGDYEDIRKIEVNIESIFSLSQEYLSIISLQTFSNELRLALWS
jgi:hypothetical protein